MGRKISSGAIVWAAILCTAGIMGYSYFTIKHGIAYEKSWNQSVAIVKYNDGRYGIRSESTGEIVGRFDEVIPCEPNDIETTALVVVKDGLYGYVSAITGKMIFEPQFLYAWIDNAENHLAACVNSEHKLGFVNVCTKETAIPFQYEFDEAIPVADGKPIFDFVFHNRICIIPGKDGKLGMIDETGKQILPAIYSDIVNWRKKSSIIILKRQKDSELLYDAYDRELNVLYPLEYDHLHECYYDSEKPIYIALRNETYGILDASLKEILPFEFDYIDSSEYNHDAYIVEVNGKYGVLSESSVLIPIKYDLINEIYLGEEGCEFGYVAVTNYTQKLFDSNGVLLSDFYVDTIENYDSELDKNVTYTGLEVIPELFNQGASPYIKYQLDNCCGVIDGRTREVIVPAKYDTIEYLGHGNFACVLGDKTYLISDKK